jgi:hypothetical protein
MVQTTRVPSSCFTCVALKENEHYSDPFPAGKMPEKDSLEIGALHSRSKSYCYTDALKTISTPTCACRKTTKLRQQPTTLVYRQKHNLNGIMNLILDAHN